MLRRLGLGALDACATRRALLTLWPRGPAPAAALATTAQPRTLSEHAISTPTLVDLEKRWTDMSTAEKSELIRQLEERQKAPWTELSLEEKKAAYYVSFGAHGPRADIHPPGFMTKVVLMVGGFSALAISLFFVARMLAPEQPKTLSKEWKEAEKNRLLEIKAEPLTNRFAK